MVHQALPFRTAGTVSAQTSITWTEVLSSPAVSAINSSQYPSRTNTPESLPMSRMPDMERSRMRTRTWDRAPKYLNEPSHSPKAPSPPLGPRSRADGSSSEWETETLIENAALNQAFCVLPVAASLKNNSQLSYPCPFRKRNPVRFNIRDHESCARGIFTSLTDLRCHIVMHHRAKRPAFQCPRCRSQLANVAALEQHLLMPREQMCEVNAEEPVFDREDGITEELAALLSGKDSKNEVWTWETICQVLFPGDPLMDTDIPPIVELFEIDQIFDDTQDTLKSNLREKLRMLLPPNIIDDEYCSFLSTQLDLVFETHRANIVRRCLAYATGNKDTGVGSERTSEQRNGRRMSVKKPARISRRSTLMQSIQHHTTGNKHTRTLSLKPTVGTGVRECGHWRKTSNALPVNTSYVPMGAVKTNTTTNETPLTKDTNDNDNQTHISEIEPGSREQRDSGISIPNSSHSPQGSMLPDESDNSEPPTPSSCPSTSTDISDAQDTDTQQPAQPLPNPTSTLSKRLKPRPGRLNLNVGVGLGLGLGIDIPLTPSTILANQFESISAGGAGHATDRKGSNERGYLGECLTAPLPIDSPRGRNAEDGECHGGLFSPESFKQRVLRGRMSGVLGG